MWKDDHNRASVSQASNISKDLDILDFSFSYIVSRLAVSEIRSRHRMPSYCSTQSTCHATYWTAIPIRKRRSDSFFHPPVASAVAVEELCVAAIYNDWPDHGDLFWLSSTMRWVRGSPLDTKKVHLTPVACAPLCRRKWWISFRLR